MTSLAEFEVGGPLNETVASLTVHQMTHILGPINFVAFRFGSGEDGIEEALITF